MAEPALEAVEHFSVLRNQWTELALGTRNIFATWEWAETWSSHRRRDRPLLLFAVRDGDRVEAILPLYLWIERPLRVARFLGHGPADQLGPVGDATRASAALGRVAEAADLHLVVAELLPAGEPWVATLGGRVLVRESSPASSLEGGWSGYLSRRSANFRQQVRRRERNLMRSYKVRYRLSGLETLEADLDLLFSLHRARWGAKQSAFGRWEAFHRDFAAVALERDWLRLWVLELDGSPAAVWYGFRFAGVESYYQSGRNPALSDDSVGFVLLAHSVRAAAEDGIREYRFLRGAEPYKRRFSDRDEGLESIALTRGIRGKVASVPAAVLARHMSVGSLVTRLGRFG